MLKYFQETKTNMDLQTKPNPAVVHPTTLRLNRKTLQRFNDRFALRLGSLYGAAFTIWIFAGYSFIGALVGNSTRDCMLFWSNSAQLVFCPLSLYAATLLRRRDQAKDDADHLSLTHIANVVDLIADKVDAHRTNEVVATSAKQTLIPPAEF
jgi:hypothetical protein